MLPNVTDMPENNLEVARAELAVARVAGDEEQAALLDALIGCGGSLLIYRPERQHYGVLFGDLEHARHVAVVVPGVGDEKNLRQDWLPAAKNLFEAAPSTAVILWKGYDNPRDLVKAALESVECDEHLMAAGSELTGFVRTLPLRPDQTLTLVAHSFGSLVTGAALADCDLHCTDVVVAGSPGMSVDDLRQLHLKQSHFFSEEAPGDAVAELGIFGEAPTSPTFGGTRMRTNAPGHVEVTAHAHYFVPGSEALENIVDVVTGRYSHIASRRPSVPEVAGGCVAWTLRIPTLPIGIFARHYRGPGYRVLINTRRLVDFTATQTGNLVRNALDESERALTWIAHAGQSSSSVRPSLPAGGPGPP
jgi:pimeloyl-ACP methyl ester carboxylesterase